MQTVDRNYLPYIFYALLAGLIMFGTKYILNDIYDKGVAAGKLAQTSAANAQILKYQEGLDEQRAKIQSEAQSRIDLAKHDSDAARAATDKLLGELGRIQSIAGKAGVVVKPGATPSEAISVLANMLSEAVSEYREVAEFADSSYNASLTCSREYDSLGTAYDKWKATN